MDKEKKTKVIRYSLGAFIFLVLFIFTLFLLNYAKNKNYDIEVLSTVEFLRSDIIYFYSSHNVYPVEIKSRRSILEKDLEEECSRNLCLDSTMVNKTSSLNIKYLPCEGEEQNNCSLDIVNPQGYRFIYSLKSR